MLVNVIQDGTSDCDYLHAAAADEFDRVLLAGYTKGNWSGVNAGDRDFASILLERPTYTLLLATSAPSVAPISSPIPPAESDEQPMSGAAIAGTVVAVVVVAALIMGLWIWRRYYRRKDESPQYPRPIPTTPNVPYPCTDPRNDNPVGASESVNIALDNAPPPYDSLTPRGPPVVGESTWGLIAPPAGAFEPTMPATSAVPGTGLLPYDPTAVQRHQDM